MHFNIFKASFRKVNYNSILASFLCPNFYLIWAAQSGPFGPSGQFLGGPGLCHILILGIYGLNMRVHNRVMNS